MTSNQFFGLEKDNPHDHIRWFNKITSTIKYKDAPAIKLMLFPFSLAGAARRWLEKEPSRSILTWEDLVSKFINEFFPSSRTTNRRNEISKFQQLFDKSFHEACDRYKDLLHACHHHGFTELHQLDTFYNAINPADQDSLNSAAVAICWKDVLKIQTYSCSQSANKCCDYRHDSYSQIISSNPTSSFRKSHEEICVTCGGAHPYYQCLAAGGNTFSELKDNIQGYVAAVAVNHNQGNSGYRPLVVPLSELEKIKRMNEPNMKAMQTQINNVKNELRNEMKNSIQAFMFNQTNELKNMMASFFQMNTASTLGLGHANPKGELKSITTRSGVVLDGPFVPIPHPFINPKEDERVEDTLMNQDLTEYTIKVPPPLVQKLKPPSQRNFVVHQRDPLHPNISYPSRMHKQKQQEKDEKLPEKLGDLGKFLISCGFSELKCKALADLGASIKLMPLSIWKKVRDVFVPVGKFIFQADFVIVDYESDPRVPLILGRPFLRTARALIDVHGEEMILRDGDERLTLNMSHDTSSYSNQPQKESINMINIYDDSNEDFLENLFATNHQSGNPTFSSHPNLTLPEVKDDVFDPEGGNVLIEKLLDLDSTKDIHPPHNFNPLSGSTTSSSPNHLLEEFADELALITFPPGNDDLLFDIESDLKEIEYMLNHDPIKEMDSILKDSIDQIEFDTEYVYDDPFDSKREKIKESKLLIDDLDLPSDFLPSSEYDSFLFEDFFEVDALPSTNNEDKDVKKLAISHASLILEDFDPPLYKLPFFKEVPRNS
nr:reverse transcriptase domain-containing protein [Tanacetum cinerariifolium]